MPINSSSAIININNLTAFASNLAATSGTLNASSAGAFSTQLQAVATFFQSLLAETQAGRKTSS